MKTPNLLLAVSLSLIIFACASKEDSQVLIKECLPFELEEGDVTDIVEYKIIDAVVENDFSNRGEVQIINTSDNGWMSKNESIAQFLADEGLELSSQEINEYLTKNSTFSFWNPLFESSVLASVEDKDCLFKNNPFSCESYLNKYPEGLGYTTFNRPAYFNNDIALVQYNMDFCDGVRGNIVILKRVEGKWSVANSKTIYIS